MPKVRERSRGPLTRSAPLPASDAGVRARGAPRGTAPTSNRGAEEAALLDRASPTPSPQRPVDGGLRSPLPHAQPAVVLSADGPRSPSRRTPRCSSGASTGSARSMTTSGRTRRSPTRRRPLAGQPRRAPTPTRFPAPSPPPTTPSASSTRRAASTSEAAPATSPPRSRAKGRPPRSRRWNLGRLLLHHRDRSVERANANRTHLTVLPGFPVYLSPIYPARTHFSTVAAVSVGRRQSERIRCRPCASPASVGARAAGAPRRGIDAGPRSRPSELPFSGRGVPVPPGARVARGPHDREALARAPPKGGRSSAFPQPVRRRRCRRPGGRCARRGGASGGRACAGCRRSGRRGSPRPR